MLPLRLHWLWNISYITPTEPRRGEGWVGAMDVDDDPDAEDDGIPEESEDD